MVFRCRKNFVREIFAVTDNRENFLTAKISQYTIHCVSLSNHILIEWPYIYSYRKARNFFPNCTLL